MTAVEKVKAAIKAYGPGWGVEDLGFEAIDDAGRVVDSGRWHEYVLYVVDVDGEPIGIERAEGLTENQEDREDAEVYPVRMKTVTRVEWERES